MTTEKIGISTIPGYDPEIHSVIHLTFEWIRTHFGHATFQKGADYFFYHMLKTEDIYFDGLILHGRCRGSLIDPYTEWASFQSNGQLLDTRCSCPIGGHGECKHVVALLMKLVDEDLNRIKQLTVAKGNSSKLPPPPVITNSSFPSFPTSPKKSPVRNINMNPLPTTTTQFPSTNGTSPAPNGSASTTLGSKGQSTTPTTPSKSSNSSLKAMSMSNKDFPKTTTPLRHLHQNGLKTTHKSRSAAPLKHCNLFAASDKEKRASDSTTPQSPHSPYLPSDKDSTPPRSPPGPKPEKTIGQFQNDMKMDVDPKHTKRPKTATTTPTSSSSSLSSSTPTSPPAKNSANKLDSRSQNQDHTTTNLRSAQSNRVDDSDSECDDPEEINQMTKRIEYQKLKLEKQELEIRTLRFELQQEQEAHAQTISAYQQAFARLTSKGQELLRLADHLSTNLPTNPQDPQEVADPIEQDPHADQRFIYQPTMKTYKKESLSSPVSSPTGPPPTAPQHQFTSSQSLAPTQEFPVPHTPPSAATSPAPSACSSTSPQKRANSSTYKKESLSSPVSSPTGPPPTAPQHQFTSSQSLAPTQEFPVPRSPPRHKTPTVATGHGSSASNGAVRSPASQQLGSSPPRSPSQSPDLFSLEKSTDSMRMSIENDDREDSSSISSAFAGLFQPTARTTTTVSERTSLQPVRLFTSQQSQQPTEENHDDVVFESPNMGVFSAAGSQHSESQGRYSEREGVFALPSQASLSPHTPSPSVDFSKSKIHVTSLNIPKPQMLGEDDF